MPGTSTVGHGRRNEQSARSQERILEATIDLAAAVGYDGTTVAKVVEATGLPPSSIYWHFGNKEKLVAAALRHSFDLLRSQHPVWPAPLLGDDLITEVTRAIRAAQDPSREDRYLRLGLMLTLEGRTDAARREFDQIRANAWQNLQDWWCELLTRNGWSGEGAVAETMTRFTLSALDGYWMPREVMPTEVDVAHSVVLMLVGQAEHLIANPQDAVTTRVEPMAVPRPSRVPAALVGRERLLSAGEQVVAEHGLDRSTVARICRRAGLPASSLYWFFENKEELIGEVVATGYRRFTDAAAWAPLTAEDLVTNDWMHQGLRASAVEADIFRIGHMLLLRRDESAAQRAFIRIRQEFADSRIEWFTHSLGLDPHWAEELAWAMVVVSDGALMGWAADRRRPLVDAADLLTVGLKAVLEAGGVHLKVIPRVGDPAD